MTRRSHVITVDGDGNVTEDIELFSYNLNVTQLRMDPNFIRWTKCVYKNFLQFQSDNANNILFGSGCIPGLEQLVKIIFYVGQLSHIPDYLVVVFRYYINWTRLVFTCVLPVLLLISLNGKIFRAIRFVIKL